MMLLGFAYYNLRLESKKNFRDILYLRIYLLPTEFLFLCISYLSSMYCQFAWFKDFPLACFMSNFEGNKFPWLPFF